MFLAIKNFTKALAHITFLLFNVITILPSAIVYYLSLLIAAYRSGIDLVAIETTSIILCTLTYLGKVMLLHRWQLVKSFKLFLFNLFLTFLNQGQILISIVIFLLDLLSYLIKVFLLIKLIYRLCNSTIITFSIGNTAFRGAQIDLNWILLTFILKRPTSFASERIANILG